MDYGYLKFKAQNGKSGIFWEPEKKKTDRKFGYKRKDQRFTIRKNPQNIEEVEQEPEKEDDKTPKPNFIERNRQLAASKNKGKKPTLRPLKQSPTGTVTLTQDQLNAILASVGKVASGEEDNLRISIDSKKNSITIESPRKSREGDYYDHNSAESGYDDDDKYNDDEKDTKTKQKKTRPSKEEETTIFSLLEEFSPEKPSKSSKKKEIEKKKFEMEEREKLNSERDEKTSRDRKEHERNDHKRNKSDIERKEKDRSRKDYDRTDRDSKHRDRNNHHHDDDDHDDRGSRHKKKGSRDRRRYSPEQQDSDDDDYHDRDHRKKDSRSHRRKDSPDSRERTHRHRRSYERERTPSDDDQDKKSYRAENKSPDRAASKPPTGLPPPPKPLTLAEKKKLQWERDRIELAKQYDPWGKPGAGAPIRTKSGNVAADYKTRQVPTRVVHDRRTFLID